jgi:L-amino acid N-acyltransferase YncA
MVRLPSAEKLVLIDTNVLIHLEEYRSTGRDVGRKASDLARDAAQLGYTVVIGEPTLDDLARSGGRATEREREVARIPVVPSVDVRDLAKRAGYGMQLDDNDDVDVGLLALLDQSKVAWVITEDHAMIHHAHQADLHHALSLDEALQFLEPAVNPVSVPRDVHEVLPEEIATDVDFFDSLKDSYEGFDEWWKGKVVAENRLTLILGSPDNIQGLAVVKDRDPAYGLPADTAKICTFKIHQSARGKRRGELLLRALIQALRELPTTTAFLEVNLGVGLDGWLRDFGFSRLAHARAENEDIVMVKDLGPGRRRAPETAWDYHKTFGPGALKVQDAFLVPIQPRWHEALFPNPHEVQGTLDLGALQPPYGNAITKVYISAAQIRSIRRGDLLLFVESETNRMISNLGIVEETLVSADPLDIIRFAADRTVYSPQDLADMTSTSGELLVLKFRHDRRVEPAWTFQIPGYRDLVGDSPIQSIRTVRPEGKTWIKKQLGV